MSVLDYGDPTPEGENWKHRITIATQRTFDLRDGTVIDPLD